MRRTIFYFLLLVTTPIVCGQKDLSYEEITAELEKTIESDVFPYMLGVMSPEERQLFQEIEIQFTDGFSISPVSDIDEGKRVIIVDRGFLYLLYRVSEAGFYSARRDEQEQFLEYLSAIYKSLKAEGKTLNAKYLKRTVKPYWRWMGTDFSLSEENTELFKRFRKKNMKHILTYVLAHEFGHHYLGQQVNSKEKKIALSEFAADSYGVELTYRSGRFLMPSKELWDFYIMMETIENERKSKVTNESALCRSARMRGFVSLALRDTEAMRHLQKELKLIRKEAEHFLTLGDCDRTLFDSEMKEVEKEFNTIEAFRRNTDSLCETGDFQSIHREYIQLENSFCSQVITKFRKASVLHNLLMRLTDEYEQYDLAIEMTNQIIPLSNEWGNYWVSRFYWIRANAHWYGSWLVNYEKRDLLSAKEDYQQCLRYNDTDVNAHMQMYFISSFEEDVDQAIEHLQMVPKCGSNRDNPEIQQGISMLIQLLELNPEKVFAAARKSCEQGKRSYGDED